MIAPASPATTMVDDPRLPTVPTASPVVAEAPKRRRSPPPDRFDDDDDGSDDDAPRKRNSKVVLVVATTIVLGLGIATLVFLGSANKRRFVLACEPQQVIAKQGRGFPPWGERNIDDEGMWKPIKIPPEAECTARETDDDAELSKWYLQILVDRASTALTAKEGATHGSKEVDEAFAMLEQALLHTRPTDRREQRRDIERLLGDVGYWRATGKLKDAANALADAAKQFDGAAAQRPRHVSDASAWATYVRKLVEDLKAGPSGAGTTFPPTPPNPDRQPAPPGVALPVEPPKPGSGSADPIAPIDAGLPTGGVLL
jgi:hypothetical protein